MCIYIYIYAHERPGEGYAARGPAKAARPGEEAEAAKVEQRVMDGEVATPETVEEFERLVMASPDSSLCWIQYMAFHMQVRKTVDYNGFFNDLFAGVNIFDYSPAKAGDNFLYFGQKSPKKSGNLIKCAPKLMSFAFNKGGRV